MKLTLFFATLLSFPLAAHIGNQDIFFEGLAGPYPLYVNIRPPSVIPGVAEISLRAGAKDIDRIRLTPMPLTGPGSKYPPTPDLALRSNSDPQLFTGGLWIMYANAWQVQVMVDGARGSGVLSVPVPAVSSRVTQMDNGLSLGLGALMLLLLAGLIGIAGAALRESQLLPGQAPGDRQRRQGRIAMGTGLVLGALIVYFGQQWWQAEAAGYSRSLYKPLGLLASLKSGLQGQTLDLQLVHNGWAQSKELDDFVPDHGHLMHLYAVRTPEIDQVFHLHPNFAGKGRFSLLLPTIPPGNYRLFGDIVHRNGFPETVTASLDVPANPVSTATPPGFAPDDSGAELAPGFALRTEHRFPDQGSVILDLPTAMAPGQPLSLRFRVRDRDGNPAANLRPYLGMSAHLAVFRQDLGVFSHVHPAGNISMAALELAQRNLFPIAPPSPPASHGEASTNEPIGPDFSFPYGFPSPGNYRLVLQFRRLGKIETAFFDINIKN